MSKIKIGFEEMIKDAHEEIETIPVSDAIDKHESPAIQIVDLRDVRELQRDGMIPGAIHCPRGMLEFWVHPESPYHKSVFAQPDKKFVFYCASGWRSALSVKQLQALGFGPVAHIGGGFSAWKEAGGPVAQKA